MSQQNSKAGQTDVMITSPIILFLRVMDPMIIPVAANLKAFFIPRGRALLG